MDNIKYIQSHDFKEIGGTQTKNLEKAKFFDHYLHREVAARSKIFEYKNLVIGEKMLSKGGSDMRSLLSFFRFSVKKDFVIDNVVPYLSNERVSRKILNINDIPSSRYDPMKPLRLASLFGWYFVNSQQLEEIEERLPYPY